MNLKGDEFRQEVVFSAKYFHGHNFVNFILITVLVMSLFLNLSEHKKKQEAFASCPV